MAIFTVVDTAFLREPFPDSFTALTLCPNMVKIHLSGYTTASKVVRMATNSSLRMSDLALYGSCILVRGYILAAPLGTY